MKKLFLQYIEDILIISGVLAIITATFLISKIAALYVLGLFLFAFGVYFSIKPPGGNRKR